MRGKALYPTISKIKLGITPAYAGKRFTIANAPHTVRDHPRLCGEKITRPTTQKDRSGSPPPMRGKAFHDIFSLRIIRITPAYAGKSVAYPVHSDSGRDHPRLCGEKLLLFARRVLFLGSPPPMRGKGIEHRFRILAPRITPAYAGKRHLQTCNSLLAPDHPRLCGEKRTAMMPECSTKGSPPPMRGKG